MADDQQQAVDYDALAAQARQAKPPQVDYDKLAADVKTAQAHVDAGQSVPHPIVARILDWLPGVGAGIGGVLGAVGGLPGSVGGAALGGGSGESFRQLGNRLAGNPAPPTSTEAAEDIGKQALLQGATQVLGPAMGKTASYLAPKLMQSAVKPAFGAIDDMVKSGEAPQVVKTLLKDGISVTASGIRKINSLISTGQDTIKAVLSSPSAGLVDPMSGLSKIPETVAKFATQGTPQADVATIRQAADQFVDAWVKDPATGDLKAKWSSDLANEIKQGTYRKATDAAYGEMSSAAKEAQKAIGRGIKEGIETANPDTPIKAMNAEQGQRIDAAEVVGRRWAMAHNLDPAGLAPAATKGVGFLTMLMSRSPAIKSMLANGMYQQAGLIAGVSPNVIRAAMAALSMSSEDQK